MHKTLHVKIDWQANWDKKKGNDMQSLKFVSIQQIPKLFIF